MTGLTQKLSSHPVEPAGSPIPLLGVSHIMGRWVVPPVLAVVLFGLNNVAIFSGLLNPPQGYVPSLMVRGTDIAVYMTWLRGFQSQLLLPDYQAPWQTEPALFNLLFWIMARVSTLIGAEPIITYHLFHFGFYLVAAYALFFALRVFTETPKQAYIAVLTILCSVPIVSLAIVPVFILTGGRWRVLWGIGDFVWWSSDGFFHGISGSLLVTFGTGITIAAFGLLGRYLATEKKRYLGYACLCTFLSALIHPFEVVVIVAAGAITLGLRTKGHWSRALQEGAMLGLSGAIGATPYLFMASRYAWLQDATRVHEWYPGSPIEVLNALGLPTVLVLAFMVLRQRTPSKTDLLLQCWFVCTLLAIYIPWIRWSQHLLDGFHYVTGILLVRLAMQSTVMNQIRAHAPKVSGIVFAAWCLLSLPPYVAFYWQSYLDGRAIQPDRLFSTVAPIDEQAAIAWLQQNARPDQLVLAPLDEAPWFATVPMHSFASHWAFSLTYAEQAGLTEEFYLGKLDPDAARAVLTSYGVRYIVMPNQSPALRYVEADAPIASIGSLTVYELNDNMMKPYRSPRQ